MSTSRWRPVTRSFVAVVLGFIGATSAAQQPGFAGRGQRSQGLGSGYSRPARSAHGSRSEVIAPYSMVAASQPLAVQIGIDILKAGGNAIDAAVAVNAMLGLVEPHMSGVGGDLFAVFWDARTEKLYALNATGRAPYRLNRDVFKARGLDRVPGSGPLSWTVPGAVDGWDQLLTRFGTMNFEQVLAPVIAYARDGFPVSEIISGDWQRSAGRLSEWPDSTRTFLPGGRAPRPGDVFKNPNLANTYELIARQGRNAFYKGPIAEKIVAFSEDNGGYFSMRDFEDHTSTWVEPVSTGYHGYDVWELPPNSHGITALIMLNIMEGFDLKSMGHNSAQALHVITEAKKLAFADRGKYVADPEANPLPTAELISKEYGAKRRALLDLEKAAPAVTAGDPFEHSETIYMTVVDKDRNAISLIESNYASFGSNVVPADLGFVIQNRGSGFSLDPDHLNSLEPHKRSLHTNMPGFVTKEGKPFLSFGVMGGTMQPQGHVQVLSNIIDFGMNIQEAGDAARVRHSPDTSEALADAAGGTLRVEPGVTDEVIEQLRRLGHRVERAGGGWMGGYQAIMIHPETGMLHGGTDPRKDGLVIGY